MKRHGNLWPNIIDFENLLLAARKAEKGKRFRENVLDFNFHLEQELIQLHSELTTKTYQPGAYKTFKIIDPKPRIISAAPYRDRVVHHALCQVICPLFEHSFITDSYANRVGFGTHKALGKFIKFSRSSRYVLQCDIRKYFPSIDLEILKALIHRKIKCQDTLWLIDAVIDGSNQQETVLNYFPGDTLITPAMRRRGLPIGNLTSQFFSNVYLNGFDHFIKEELHAKRYVRYVDDFALFSDDKAFLQDARQQIEDYLATLRLKIHPIKSQLFETKVGATFLGFRVLPDRIRVCSSNLKRGRRRIKELKLAYQRQTIPLEQVQQSLQSWFAHLNHGDTWQLQKKILSTLPFAAQLDL
ncbi:RNA-directed DNA polymerase [Leptothoe sp. PORK10 BA2]|uniref:RNA-directed DNA polymerase n=1 Tax=Leptothoe sp. PORK10 BA2 TaxID=3110254 RepID=UPI002B1FAE3E|nr:RNA-directed DNA polymerase [Leptothoe sp. PORK10 BA2]MEA5464352.1 RNA-directed DNA polymerase [Leptothoe sp. PORK10 BA2]